MNEMDSFIKGNTMSYCYIINSMDLNFVTFASTHAAYNYAVKHNIRTSTGKIKAHRHRVDTAISVRKGLMEKLKEVGGKDNG